jgi:hypothetical protein
LQTDFLVVCPSSDIEEILPSTYKLGEKSMSPRLERAIECLSSGNSEAVQEAILLIGEVGVFCRRGIKSDVLPEANEDHLGQEELQILERALVDLVERDPFGPDAGSAIWSLSKFCDRDIIRLYRVWLQRYVDQLRPSAFALGQLLVSLDNLGERTVTGGSFSADEFGKNFDDAIAYLKRQKERPTNASSQ